MLRGLTVTRTGMPRRSASLNFTPAELLAVVEEDVEAGVLQLLVDLLRALAHAGLVEAQCRRGGRGTARARRPDDAALVVVRLDRAGEDAPDADAVAAHDGGLLLAVLVGELRLHRLGVDGAELEDVAHLDAALRLERAAAVRAGVAGAARARCR